MTTLEIAYVLLYFPRLTETFVAQEIWEAKQQGVKVHIFSLLPPKSLLVHAVSEQLLPQVQYVPKLYHPSLWWAQLHFLFRSPYRYSKLLWELLTQPFPRVSFLLRRLVVFVKGIYLAKQLKGSPVMLVHAHFAWLSAAAAIVISRMLDLPFTVTTHAFDIYSEKNDLLRFTARAADHIIAISEFNKQALRQICPDVEEDSIDVIYCGIDPDEFQPSVRQSDPANRVIRILSVGSLIEKKGHEYLIRACKQLKAQGVNFQCTIVGEGRLRSWLQAIISESRLEDAITLVGSQKQTWIRDALQDSHLFVLACVVTDEGDCDGIPVSIMEALAMETSVISTWVTGIPELVRNEETGLLVPEKDPTALAAAIDRLVEDETLRRQLAINGRKLVSAEFDTHKNVAQLVSLFHRTIEEYQYDHKYYSGQS